MICPYEIEANMPLYKRGEPLQACPGCSEGIIRYNYVIDANGQIKDYVECDNILCGVYISIETKIF